MARAATQTAGRRTAAPPPAAANIYEEVWEAVTAHNSSFAAPGERESDQGFFKRLTKAVSDLPPDVKMSPDAEAWYDTASRQFEAGSEIDEPPGFNDEQGGQEQEQEQEEEQPEERAARSDARNGTNQPSPAQAASRSAGAERLRQYREQKAAEQAGGAAGRTGGRRGAAAPAPAAPATGRRGAAQQAPAPTPAPRRGAQQQPAQEAGTRRRGATPATPAPAAPAPRRSTAAGASRRSTPAAAADDAGTSIARFARLHIIANPNVTLDDLIAAAEAQGYNPTRSTMAGNLTFMRNAIDVVKETGHWRD